MELVTMYKSDDGAVWHSAAQAKERDEEIRSVKELERILSKPRPSDLSGWMRQDPVEVKRLKEALVLIAAKRHPDDYWNTHKADDLVHPGSYPSRVISESDGPFSSLWWRACSIDESGREWEQWFYRLNPEKGLARWPEPTVE